jgi:hypothetical protein
MVQDNLSILDGSLIPTTSQEAINTINSSNASTQGHVQSTAALNIPVMSLVQATNGQMFLLTTNQQPQYNQISDTNLTTPSQLPISTLGYLTTPNAIQPIHCSTQPQYLFSQQGQTNYPQLYSNVINQNNYHTMIIGQLPSSLEISSKPTITPQKQPNASLPKNILSSSMLPKYCDKVNSDSENAKCILTQDSQTKQSILTSYGRQHQQNISKSSENQANTIITNLTTLKSEQQLLNQENVNVTAEHQHQQHLTNNSIQQHQVLSPESLKQLSATSSSSSSLSFPSLLLPNVHKQIQLSLPREETESQHHLSLPSTTLISVDNMAQQQQTIQNDCYLFKRSENEGVQESFQSSQKKPCDNRINPSEKNCRNGKEEAIVWTSLEQNKSEKKINCLRSVRRKTNIEHIFPNNIISMPQLPHQHQQQNKVILNDVNEEKPSISWRNYHSSTKEGDIDIDLIKRIPAQLTNFNRSSSLSPHPSSVSFSNGYFRACNIASAEGNETLATINFGENEESLRLLEKHESNNNMTKTGNVSVNDIIKVAMVESKVC